MELLTREQLLDRMVALYEAGLELVKDVSIESLLERIVEVARQQVGARYAALGVLDEKGKLKQFITTGLSAETMAKIPHPPVGKGLIGALMKNSRTIRIPDISTDHRSYGFPPGHPKMRSFLGVPIMQGALQLGQIYLTDKLDAPEFTDDDELIIKMLSASAAAAIHNANTYENLVIHDLALTRRNQDLALLNQISSSLASSLDLDELLNKTLAQLLLHFKVEAGEIFLLDKETHTLRLVLHRGKAAEAFWEKNTFQLGEGVVGMVAKSMKPIFTNELDRDERFLRSAVVEYGFKQIVCVPLSAPGEVVGVMSMASLSPNAISDGDLSLLMSIGTYAGTAIDNARLHTNARRLAILEERERIGMDLHDGIIQSIYGVGLGLQNVRHLMHEDLKQADRNVGKAIEDLNSTIHDLRTYILDLKPRQMRGGSLLESTQRLVEEFRSNVKSEIILSIPKNDFLLDLPQNNALALFLVCQETLANVAKHADAKKVTVNLWSTGDRVLLEVHDDGTGFDESVINKSVGHGLANMVTRVQNVNGDLDITSVIGEGTTVLAWVPRHIGGRYHGMD
ncbi:MAG TPA: GAF domain-containing sensor histidine kinase [Anaerolineales bacterium]|nr:GAF domain-containing sensor histidine kinase [Anaerolineales bacterium]